MKTENKGTIKFLSLMLAICLLLSACGRSSGGSTSYDNQDDTSDEIVSVDGESISGGNENNEPLHKTEIPEGYIGIYKVDDLINSGKNESANYIIMNDLDLSSVSDWEGIVNRGNFDGNNYTIKNLKSSTGGLFSYSENLMNFKLENININVVVDEVTSSFMEIGGLTNYGCALSNCSVSGNINVKIEPKNELSDYFPLSERDETYYIGGIVGCESLSEDYIISSCVNNAIINVENIVNRITRVGGVLGYGSGSVIDSKNYGLIKVTSDATQNSIAGGICGSSRNCQRCGNYGEIYSAGIAGGVVGGLTFATYEIDSCYNSGNILSDKHESLDSYLGEAKGSCAGGIVGYIDSATEGIIKNSYNVGKCSGANNCGEIVGGRYHYQGLDIKYCAYCGQNNIGLTGDSAMFADNKAMTIKEMEELSNYPFDNKELTWTNGTGEYRYPVIK